MYDERIIRNFARSAEAIMTSADAVECLLDFSKGPEAIVTTVRRQPYFVPSEETRSYTVLEANRKSNTATHPAPSTQSPTSSPITATPNFDDSSTNSFTCTTTISPKPRAICSFCGKCFSHLGDHNKHRRRHTGERPYPCDLCTRRFAHASNLARHRRLHSGEKPFECTNCSRRFSRRDKLAAHVERRACFKLMDRRARPAKMAEMALTANLN